MTARTFVFVVCSLSGRAGKTTTARLLGDYFLAHEPDFARRFPDEAIVADISTIQGQMALIDPLLENDAIPKIIDLWHRSFEAFFTLIDHTGFISEARSRGVEPILLYVDNGAPRAVDVAARIGERYPGLLVMMVQNQMANTETADETGTLRSFRIGRIDPLLQATIDKPGFSLSQFMRAPPPDMSIVLRAGLRDWVWRVFSQFKSFELRMTLSESEHLG
jgi:hypothetical protein